MEKEKTFKIYDLVLILFFVTSVIACPMLYTASLVRAWDGLKDFWFSLVYYFSAFADVETKVTVIEFPSLDVLDYLPYDFDEIFRKLKDMWGVFFDSDCFRAYMVKISRFFNTISKVSLPLIIIIPCLFISIKSKVLEPNEDKHGERSKYLLWFEGKPLEKIRALIAWFKELFNIFASKKYYLYPISIIWLLNLNIVSIGLEFLAYYFYFAMSQDVLNLFSIQIGKLMLDVVIMLSSAPLVFWLIVAYAIICIVRRYIGFKKLDEVEESVRAFMKRLPICILVCGLMGSKKTTTITDMAISEEIRLRNDALENILEIDCKFPNFPWINLEDDIKKAMEERKIRSLTTCRDYVSKKLEEYIKHKDQDHIFGYDVEKYRYYFMDNLKIYTIWQAIKDYAQSYFVYTIQSSLLVSNYSVRVDNVLENAGNFPLWNTDLFRRKPDLMYAVSRHAHILDYEMLRVGKTIIAENPKRGSLEFGVVLISEIAKELGNNLSNQEIKRNSEESNVKNELIDYWIKMCRHKATICGKPFIRVIADEQRPEDLGALNRDVFNVLHIRKSGDFQLVMPCFFITELIHDIVHPKHDDFNLDYKFAKGDTTLFKYLYHNLLSEFHNFYKNTYNLFGVCELEVDIESGTLNGEYEKSYYYISSKKTYSNRFTTDCYAQFFENLVRASEVGLDEMREYNSIQPTAEEFDLQHSRFIAKMSNIGGQAA